MNTLLSLALILATSRPPDVAPKPAPSLRRFALVVGANRGGEDRPALRYAVRDAERFNAVLTSMGGVAPGDSTLLREPAPRAFMDALAILRTKAAEARPASARVEVLVYFSGHADDTGLLLGAERLKYADLRDTIRAMPVDVGIAVLDACASGAITRLKGGQAYPGFLSDSSMDVKGYAFLASSSEGEAAQESDRLGGSYFTGALLTGMRGAADVSGDGRVTLGEAYQFAFNETLAQTTTSQGGAQHPSYDIKMAGTGDVVMTDVRKVSASLILGAEYDGRFYVLDSAQHLVAELSKGQGRAIELGLEPGDYRVYYEQSEKLMSTSLRLSEGQRQELVSGGLKPAKRLPTMRRGEAQNADLLNQRSRFEGTGGFAESIESAAGGWRIGDAPWGISFLHWARPNMALEISMTNRGLTVSGGSGGTFVGSTRGVLVGGRYYPRVPGAFRPFVLGGLGVFDDVGIDLGAASGLGFGGQVGVGGDLYLGRRFSLSAQGLVNPVSGRETHFDVRVGAGWSFGGPPRK